MPILSTSNTISLRYSNSTVKFDIYIPGDILKPFVKSFAISEEDEPQTYKVLPDTGVVIGFQYKGKLSRINNNTEIPLATSGVSGLSDTYRVFKNSAGIGTVLVFFKEGGASAFFKVPVHELFRESISLDAMMLRSELLVLEEQLAEAEQDIDRIAVVERFLIAHMQHVSPDSLVLAAVSLIHKSKGNIRIADLAQQLHITQSPLEKRFRKIIGASPKKFASIVRMKHVLHQYNPETSLTGLGYEAGFYDQAHFIKEFKNFTGDTPENFFAGQ